MFGFEKLNQQKVKGGEGKGEKRKKMSEEGGDNEGEHLCKVRRETR